MIYVAEILNGKWVKVGYSEEDTCLPRLAQLQTGSPFKIELIFTIQGTLMQEQSLHSALKVALGRIRLPTPPNEWYQGNHPFFKKFLIDLRYGVAAGLMYLDKYDPCVHQPGQKIGASVETKLQWAETPKIKNRESQNGMNSNGDA